jgi:hypothetical protein
VAVKQAIRLSYELKSRPEYRKGYLTMFHELAHHFGISDDRLRELGAY